MVDQLREFNRRVCGQKPEEERQKQDRNKGFNNVEVVGAITNICYELLERIFENLDLEKFVERSWHL